jgi:hypothetical protein
MIEQSAAFLRGGGVFLFSSFDRRAIFGHDLPAALDAFAVR